MSNTTIFTICMCSSIGLITVFTVIVGIKEGKDSLKKLIEHEELKKKKSAGSQTHFENPAI